MSSCYRVERKEVKGLTKAYAEYRSSVIGNTHYDLHLSLDGENESYTGTVDVHFTLQERQPITLDFREGAITSLRVNGKKENIVYNHLFLKLSSGLKKGKNKISIEYSHPYSRSGAGLYRYKDPEDGRVYLYSDFEPDDASLMFPCFDQPDIKASYTVTAEAPSNWVVVSSTMEKSVKKLGRGRKLWTFPKSALFSTYIFSLHAGPYRMWKSKAGTIPLRLFARQSFAKHVKAKDWFLITQQGFKFYQKYFGYRYPFHKYDQLVVADFNSGAMENVAAVTFNEAYMPRGEWTQTQRENIAEVILHEMAHMWFGNLVTMKWWDDLWLNESFASYMATLASASATEFKKAWKSFFGDMKQWAYWEDQLVTTHPIVAKVPDTQQAFANFDGITYGKGASVLKQLAYTIGHDNFRRGVQSYFKKYAFKNTTMKDFINALARAAKMDLTPWTKSWLMKAGVNSISLDYQCRSNTLKSLKIKQRAEKKHPELRHHRTQIGFYDLKGKKIVLRKTLAASYKGKSTTVSLGKSPGKSPGKSDLCPTIMYPNHGDYDYVKVQLDSHSVEGAKKHLSKIQDSFARMMMWQSLWDMVRDAQMPIQEYVDTAFLHLLFENEIKIAEKVARRLKEALYYFPNKTTNDIKLRRRFIEKTEGHLWKLMKAAESKSDFQKLWFDTYSGFVQTEDGLEALVDLFKGKVKVKGLTLDQDRRWKVVTKLNQHLWDGAASLAKKEFKRDSSERGQQWVIASEVVQPKLSAKRKWFKRLSVPKTRLSLARQKAAMGSLFPSDQDHLKEKFSKEFYAQVPRLAKQKDNTFMRYYVSNLVPTTCSKKSIKALRSFVTKHKTLSPVIQKGLKVALQEDERCLKIRTVGARSNFKPVRF